jgi:hypothetical protein
MIKQTLNETVRKVKKNKNNNNNLTCEIFKKQI